MGDPIKISDLADKMLKLSGYRKTEDCYSNSFNKINIEFTGLRPGEKLYEELLISADVENTKRKYIFKANENYISLDSLNRLLENLFNEKNLESKELILKNLQSIVPEFNHEPNTN